MSYDSIAGVPGHIRVEHKSWLLWVLAKLILINRVVQRHDDEETPLFAANCVDVCRRISVKYGRTSLLKRFLFIPR